MPPLALLNQPFGLPGILGTVLALALAGALTPLRGGHGEHADAGPGALTVAALLARSGDAAREEEDPAGGHLPSGLPRLPEALSGAATVVLHGPDRSPDSDWWDALGYWPSPNPTPAQRCAVLEHPEYRPPNAARQRPRHPVSLAEEDLAALLGLPERPHGHPPEPGYVGRHRLVTNRPSPTARDPEWSAAQEDGTGLLDHTDPRPHRQPATAV
ncbi:hypothetical protein [Actinopolyspora mortivallis]|uniref:Uncharacterized protein n=1 Tax=Actinopolyspora mortivallis TaxID=33906 RepID=A0A2T0GW44_ACTMO|nr:hypothetical protein [Actinopolyspora mortivallis]PRW63336.1 hypothetical protein CEP50_10995 [Actinopolyspora mortivallis]